MVKISVRMKEGIHYKIVATFLEIGEWIYFGLLHLERSSKARRYPLAHHPHIAFALHPRCVRTCNRLLSLTTVASSGQEPDSTVHPQMPNSWHLGELEG